MKPIRFLSRIITATVIAAMFISAIAIILVPDSAPVISTVGGIVLILSVVGTLL